MKLFEEVNLLQRLDQFFRLKATGTPCELAQKLGLSERQVRRIIEELKDLGMPIEYCKKRQTYLYKENVFMKFEISVIKGDERRKIVGGEKTNYDFFKDYFQTDKKCPSALSPLY
jgi:DNA-binding Lrp family transcriptional regulator